MCYVYTYHIILKLMKFSFFQFSIFPIALHIQLYLSSPLKESW